MLAWIREKFGDVLVSGIIGFIAFVFIFYGVFNPKATRGLHEGAVAGTVNGDSISISEFSNALNQKIEFFKKLSGGKLTDDQIKAFKIRESVFKEIANRKLLSQEAKRIKWVASDQEVREKIMEMKVFQKDGKFDLLTYNLLLKQNGYTPESFERLMAEDLTVQKWPEYLKRRSRVSEGELRQEFASRQDQRMIKFVIFEQDPAKKSLQVEDEEIKKFLANSEKVNLVKARFEQGKNAIYKGQKIEAVQDGIARDLILGEKLLESQKVTEQLAEQITQRLLAKSSGQGLSDAELNRFLSSHKTQVKSSGWVGQGNGFLSGVGEAKELFSDAFKAQSPIDLSAGGKPKKYDANGRTFIAWVTESRKPNWDEFKSQKNKLLSDVSEKKFSQLFDGYMKSLNDRAKIETNAAVVNAE